MEGRRTPEKINDNFSITVPEINDVNVIIDGNVTIQEECGRRPDAKNIVLTDNFLVDLLSRDSVVDTANPEGKVPISVENKVTKDVEESDVQKHKNKIDCEVTIIQSNNGLVSNPLISDDKLEIVTEEPNSRTPLEGVQENVTDQEHRILIKSVNDDFQENSTFSNSKCVSHSEHEIGVHNSVDYLSSSENLERACFEKGESKTDCERPSQENRLISNLADSVRKSEDKIVKEVSVQETLESNIGKEKPLEGLPHTFNQSKYRCESDIWTDDDDSSTSDSSSGSDFFQEMCEKSKPRKMPFVKTKGELSLDELPPIEDLVISVNETEMTAIGRIYAVVEKLVVIRSMKGMKALDLDSVLFLSHDQPLGRVFDVFGPVNEPFYSIRFNSVEQINEKGAKVGVEVFFAPEKSDITTYVFVEQLQNQKGSDASWKHNNEPPEEFLDYSDDEKEKNAKRQRRFKNRSRQFNDNPDASARKPLMLENTSNYIPPPKPAPHWNRSQNVSQRHSRPNTFQLHVSSPSSSPSVCGIMSPVRLQNSFVSSPNPQRLIQPQNVLYRSPPQIFVSPYQQPHHVFGQLTVLNHLSPALHGPSPLPSPVMNSVPAFVPASHFSSPPPPPPQNYFNQAFSRSPSPVTHNQHMPPDPWLSSRTHNSGNLPPSHPLTVQIPNMSSPALPMHQFPGERGQQFVNIQNGNFNEPYVNNRHFPPVNMQPRFYHP